MLLQMCLRLQFVLIYDRLQLVSHNSLRAIEFRTMVAQKLVPNCEKVVPGRSRSRLVLNKIVAFSAQAQASFTPLRHGVIRSVQRKIKSIRQEYSSEGNDRKMATLSCIHLPKFSYPEVAFFRRLYTRVDRHCILVSDSKI